MEPEREYTRAEVQGLNTRAHNVIIIDNVVYDVTEFLDDHPGGAEVLLDNGGRDASRCFRDVGHSEIALEWRDKFRRGSVVERDRWPVLTAAEEGRTPPEPLSLRSLLDVAGPPLALAALALLVYLYLL